MRAIGRYVMSAFAAPLLWRAAELWLGLARAGEPGVGYLAGVHGLLAASALGCSALAWSRYWPE